MTTPAVVITGEPTVENGVVHYGNVNVTVNGHEMVGLRGFELRCAVGETAQMVLDFGYLGHASVDMVVATLVADGSADMLKSLGWTPPGDAA